MPFNITEKRDVEVMERKLRETGKLAAMPGPEALNAAHLANDHGNASRLIVLYGGELRYCHALRKWLVWDGKRWAVDETDQARGLASQTILEFIKEAVAKHDHDAQKFACRSLDAKRIASMLSMAEFKLPIRPGDLDQNPYLLNFLNGTVDLRTGTLRPHCPSDFITKLVAYNFNPDAQCPLWKSFIDQIMGNPVGNLPEQRVTRMTEYLQRALGYSLTGSTKEKAVFVLFGPGDNGKSTMLTTIRQLIEEYAVLLQADTLMVRQESNNTQADLADLRGARFVQTSETEEGQRLAQAKLKRITQGMGKIKATRKYENPIEFLETHKLWIDTNRKPEIRDTDDRATFSRLHPIPFLATIPKHQIDRELPAKLLREAEGILAWTVAGAVLWNQLGLGKPPEVEAANQSWFMDNDQFGRFLAECCTIQPGLSCFSKPLYDAYKSWAEANGEKETIPLRTFGVKLAGRADIRSEHKDKGTCYFGIGLKSHQKYHS